LRSRLEAQAADLPVRFLGQVGRSELENLLRTCDIAVVPSVPAASGDQDGLPVTLLEAMAYGLPVVASDLPGIDEAVEHDVSGLLVPAGDAARLREAIAALARDPARRARMGARGGELAGQFSVEAVGARYRELLRQLAR
jgi:glycosyltransferase involved in cell wall biosynthesis